MRSAESRKEGIPYGERCGPGGRQAGGGGRPWCKQGAGERARLQIEGTWHGEERTANIRSMVLTLEVSKLSGWLNATAYCRESKGGHAVRDGVRAGWREVEGDRGARSVQGAGRA